jgi:broad specificity phosphatase PhoE
MDRTGGFPVARYGRSVSKVLLVRHGQSEWNAAGRWQGWADPPLSAQGRAQAEHAGARLVSSAARIDGVASSGLQRARLTAAIIAATLCRHDRARPAPAKRGETEDGSTEDRAIEDRTIEEFPELRELDVGDWSGLTREQIAARWPDELQAWRSGLLDAAPNGERRSDFDARVRDGIAAVSRRHPEGNVLVVAHGGVIRSVAHWLGTEPAPVRHLSGFWLDVDGATAQIDIAVDLLSP